jgi:hypothetical protein
MIMTNQREVCFLLGAGDTVLWADASLSPTALPDSRARWEAIWAHRARLVAIAHSHPVGPTAFSAEDRSTMAALDDALGRRLLYFVVSPSAVITPTATISPEPWWAGLLRLASGMRKDTDHGNAQHHVSGPVGRL